MPYQFDVLGLLAGLGLFLLGMDQLESGISRLSQSALRRAIRRATDTRLKSIATGVFTTALVQSSSVVSLLVLAFSAAGFVGTGNAIAVIMGTNLGSTLNPWIVAVFGFTFSIEKFALPFIALGGISLLVKKQAPLLALSGTVLMGLGLLFLGLDFMKDAVDELAASLDLADVPRYGVFVYLVSGVVFTALVQASSATLAVVLTAVNSGLLGFQEAAAVVIGANIGTTVTVILGAIGGTAEKKRVAASHFIFNAVTALCALVLLPLISAAMMRIPLLSGNAIYGIAAFHTLFNTLGILIFYPFISFLARRLGSWFREPDAARARFLNRAALGTSGNFISGARTGDHAPASGIHVF
jgi:phosphate:Na+ symporter